MSSGDSSSKESTVVPDIAEQVPRVKTFRIKGALWPRGFRETEPDN